MESKHCPVFKDTDPDLNEKIEECELKGSGCAIEVTDVKAYLCSISKGKPQKEITNDTTYLD